MCMCVCVCECECVCVTERDRENVVRDGKALIFPTSLSLSLSLLPLPPLSLTHSLSLSFSTLGEREGFYGPSLLTSFLHGDPHINPLTAIPSERGDLRGCGVGKREGGREKEKEREGGREFVCVREREEKREGFEGIFLLSLSLSLSPLSSLLSSLLSPLSSLLSLLSSLFSLSRLRFTWIARYPNSEGIGEALERGSLE